MTSPAADRIAATPPPPAAFPEQTLVRSGRLAHHARGTLAPETGRALKRALAAFEAWCSAQDLSPMPASPESVAAYVDALAEAGRAAATIRQAVWAIGLIHRLDERPDPTTAAPVRLACKRMARQLGTRQAQAAPLGEDDVRLILRLSGSRPADLRDVALLLLMRDLLARRSEAIALAVEDLAFAPDGSATALIRRGKTDPTGQGEVRWLSPRTVEHLRRWLAAAGITAGEVFRAVNKGGVAGGPLVGSDVPRILKRLAQRAGLDPARISGHSCRVGMAQDLVASGAELAAVMQAGRWKSPAMPARYAERLTAGRGAVARFYARTVQS
ncbi:tyrosine-type recombinase/integrase [Roseomonas mucosa]